MDTLVLIGISVTRLGLVLFVYILRVKRRAK